MPATTASKLASGSPMPIMTTLVIGARPLPPTGRVTPSASSDAVGVPELADDLGGREVAVEALLAGGTERAVQRAAGLRRNAQRAAVVLRDVHRLDRIAIPGIEQPLARAVGSGGIAQRGRARYLASRFSLARSVLREIGHRREIAGEALVDPPRQLLRAKRLLARARTECGERCRVEVEEVGGATSRFGGERWACDWDQGVWTAAHQTVRAALAVVDVERGKK